MVPRDDTTYQTNGNVLLDHLFGARVHVLNAGDNPMDFATRRIADIDAYGGKALLATLGGSTPVGCLGYVDCAFEITEQSAELGIEFDQIVIPNGSGGMHAGLVAGMVIDGHPPSRIKAYTVLSPQKACLSVTAGKVNAVFDLLSVQERVEEGDLIISAGQLGDGYGIPTSAMVDALRMIGRSEGLLLDPVYGGKAFAGLISDIRIGAIPASSNVLFVMTGGSPGLYAYPDTFP